MAAVGRHSGSRPSRIRVREALNGLRINQGITSAMLPGITFQPTLGITARRIDKLGIDIRSFREPLKRSIQQVVAPSFQKNFDKGGRPSWEPLSPDTEEVQQRLHGIGSHPPLVRTGHLRRRMGQFNIWTVNKDSAILRDLPADVRYGGIHQIGFPGKGVSRGRDTYGRAALARATKGKKGPRPVPAIPARPFVMLQEKDVKDISNVFDKWLGERIDRAWPK